MRKLIIAVASLAALAVVAVAVLALLGLRRGAARVEQSVDIARPPADVWRWVTEPAKQKQWVGRLVEVHAQDTGDPQPGHRMTWVLIDPNMNDQRVEIHGEYVDVEPERRSVVALDSPGMFTGTTTYELADLGDGGTRLSYVSQYEMGPWFARLLEPLVTPQARKAASEDLERLKGLAESEAPDTPGAGSG